MDEKISKSPVNPNTKYSETADHPCEVCKTNSSKYKCPKCNVRSCSLVCVKQHKFSAKCNGVKDKFTKNIKLTENDFLRDIKYMSDMINDSNSVSKQLYLQIDDDERKLKEKKQKNFKKLCKKFRSVQVERCPIFLDRFMENKSYCDSKEKKFYWTIKFNMISAKNDTLLSHVMKNPFDDSAFSLRQIFDKFFENRSEFLVEELIIINNINKDKIEKINLLYKLNKVYIHLFL